MRGDEGGLSESGSSDACATASLTCRRSASRRPNRKSMATRVWLDSARPRHWNMTRIAVRALCESIAARCVRWKEGGWGWVGCGGGGQKLAGRQPDGKLGQTHRPDLGHVERQLAMLARQ